MKFHTIELPNGKNSSPNSLNKVFLLALTLILLTIIPLCLNKNSRSPLSSPKINTNDLKSIEVEKKCDIFSGKWVPYPSWEPYYTNATCNLIIDQQNCMKFGRRDTEFLNWRWQPDQCELPLFDAAQFLELVRGKSLAFVGDSVGRNQMQSLLCLLANVAYPEDISLKYTSNTDFKHWFYAEYNFTLVTLWSPFLVKGSDADTRGHSLNSIMEIYLDEVDEAWATEVSKFDYVIISAGHWFFRPLIFYENGQVVGCYRCQQENVTDLTNYYGYRKAFRTAFRTLQNLKDYKGLTFLRTFSPAHFENGDWNKGGNCVRKRPFAKEELKVEQFIMEMYFTQVEEQRAAAKKGRERGLQYRMLDTTEAMLLRPDGHPNHYGHSPESNVTIADCVHWCLPGPIDTWNEFLLYMLKTEAQMEFGRKLQKN